jgi:microsomal dipeptidase-like Zn-dependent dipeptidase
MTSLGETLMLELMRRGMMIDIAHLPQRSLERAYELLEANEYPATKTHGDTNGGRIYLHGGMAGTSLGRCATDTPGEMGNRLKASVQEVIDNGGYPAEALAFDFNGFAHGPRPRFGDDSPCSLPQTNPITYPFTSYDGAVTFSEPQLGNRAVDFNTEGMIHIGLLPELIEDVRRDGVTDKELEPLFRSAEAYIRMWERAEARAVVLAP